MSRWPCEWWYGRLTRLTQQFKPTRHTKVWNGGWYRLPETAREPEWVSVCVCVCERTQPVTIWIWSWQCCVSLAFVVPAIGRWPGWLPAGSFSWAGSISSHNFLIGPFWHCPARITPISNCRQDINAISTVTCNMCVSCRWCSSVEESSYYKNLLANNKGTAAFQHNAHHSVNTWIKFKIYRDQLTCVWSENKHVKWSILIQSTTYYNSDVDDNDNNDNNNNNNNNNYPRRYRGHKKK